MTINRQAVESGFVAAAIPIDLVEELFKTFGEAKRRFFRSDLRPNAVEGGRFTEVVFRILQWQATQQFTPIGKTMPKVDQLLTTMENAQGEGDSVRLHIPRTLRLIYDIRNKRDTAHLGDAIDPNLQDATLVIRNMEWVFAELVRLYHNVTPGEAQKVIADLVAKDVPVIQEINGFPRILKDLRASDHTLVLLHWRGPEGASFKELSEWVPRKMRANLRRTVGQLHDKHQVHIDGEQVVLTWVGEKYVEENELIEPA